MTDLVPKQRAKYYGSAGPGDGPYFNTGLTLRTARALLASRIDTPERLLFMTDRQLSLIPLVGKVSMQEIMNYRARFGKKKSQPPSPAEPGVA
jgi:DNA-directed RNA polymerase alpha subunit